jgi:hypothetical protein
MARMSNWWDDPRIALAAFAEDQQDGSQIVVSRAGPNGWLGASPSDALRDPTLEPTPPARWVFGQVDGVGVDWGDVLLEVFNAPFTVAAAIEFGPQRVDHMEVPIVSKFFPGLNGIELYAVTGDASLPGNWLLANVKFGGEAIPQWNHYDNIDSGTTLQAGRHTVGWTYDWSRARGSRHALWVNGSPDGRVAQHAYGEESPVATSGHVQFAGTLGGGSTNLMAGSVVTVVRGAMDDAWHAMFHAELSAGGWR